MEPMLQEYGPVAPGTRRRTRPIMLMVKKIFVSNGEFAMKHIVCIVAVAMSVGTLVQADEFVTREQSAQLADMRDKFMSDRSMAIVGKVAADKTKEKIIGQPIFDRFVKERGVTNCYYDDRNVYGCESGSSYVGIWLVRTENHFCMVVAYYLNSVPPSVPDKNRVYSAEFSDCRKGI